MASDKTTTEQKLARFFREAWTVFVDGGSIDGFELQEMIEKTGLAEWRECTEEEAALFQCEMEAGDSALFLTEEGKRVQQDGGGLKVQKPSPETTPTCSCGASFFMGVVMTLFTVSLVGWIING